MTNKNVNKFVDFELSATEFGYDDEGLPVFKVYVAPVLLSASLHAELMLSVKDHKFGVVLL